MKRLAGLIFAAIIASSIAIAPAFAEMKGGMMGGGMMSGQWGQGPRGFAGLGAGYAGDHPCWQATSATATGQPLTKEQATALVQNRLTRIGNPNLKVGNVTEKDGIFDVEIVTKDNSLVEKAQINKQTGWTQRAF